MNMKRLITKDGSVTYYNEVYDDIYHSMSGALEEAKEKYTKPCRIGMLAKTGRVRVLDICFGLGYNACAALDAALDADPDVKFELIGLESDPKILALTEGLDPEFENYGMIRSLARDLSFRQGGIDMKILLGDARKTICDVKGEFDALFLDPFAPKKQPELWQAGFFSDIRGRMKRNAVLATYSSASSVRKNLEKAGFRVKDGPKVGRATPSTLAVNC